MAAGAAGPVKMHTPDDLYNRALHGPWWVDTIIFVYWLVLCTWEICTPAFWKIVCGKH